VNSIRAAVGYSAAATVAAVLVVAVAMLLVAPAEQAGVFAGAGLGLLLQVGLHWLLAVVFFPERRLLVVGLGMGARMAALLAVTLFASGAGLPLAPTLLTLVSLFVVTSLLEPVVFQLETKRAS
jgi:hypothetical protein